MRLCRDLEVEDASLPRHAIYPDTPPMEPDEFLRDSQSQTGPALVTLAGVVGAVEALEDMRRLFGG
jgi:hypothetical protein